MAKLIRDVLTRLGNQQALAGFDEVRVGADDIQIGLVDDRILYGVAVVLERDFRQSVTGHDDMDALFAGGRRASRRTRLCGFLEARLTRAITRQPILAELEGERQVGA